MFISSWYLSCVLLLVQGAICSNLQQDSSSENEKSSKKLLTETDSYDYNHPPLPELHEQTGHRKEKSINTEKQNSSPPTRSRSRGTRGRARGRASTPSLEIPVQVMYETVPTTVRSYTSTRKSTTSPLGKNTKVIVRRRQLQPNENKKIDIRQTTLEVNNTDTGNITENAQTFTNTAKSDVLPSTEFPKRSRGSYFKKRTEGPSPRVKIIEEKNFVYAHSGNFHYSFLGGDGTKVSSQGSLKSYDNNKTGEAVSGSVFYKDKDGNDYSLSYTADENGYRPVGAHLPTPPPLPPAIARALKYIADKSTPSPPANNE